MLFRSGMQKFHFAIDCFDEAELYATERQWAEDQKIKKLDGGVNLSFTSTQYDKVLQWVLSCGSNAIPRKPQELVDNWKWHVKQMVKNVSRETKLPSAP